MNYAKVSMNKKIVFVTYGGGHVNMLLPVIKQLQKRPDLDLVVLGLTTAGATLKQNNIPYIGFKDLLADDNDYAREWGKNLVNKDDLHPAISYQESVAYMGLSYVDLEIEHGIKKAAEIFANYGRQAFNPLTTMTAFLQSQSPDLLVATSAPRTERAAINAASSLNIASICISDLFAINEVKWLKKSAYATKVCVLSDTVKQRLVEHGRAEQDIIVTGNPVFDCLSKYKNKTQFYKNQFGFTDVHKVILWASQSEPISHPFSDKVGDPLLPRNIEHTLIQIANNNPKWHIVFRAHPSEKIAYKNLPNNVSISRPSDNLHELLSAIDIVVTILSTVGLEAIILGKPLITIDLSISTKYISYSKMGLSYGVSDLSQLEEALTNKVKVNNNANAMFSIDNATSNFLSVIEEYL